MIQTAPARRAHDRFRLGGIARLVIDNPDGLTTVIGHLVDLSEGGCQLVLNKRVNPHLAARVRLDVAGKAFWLPVVTRWVRLEPTGFAVGCAFDRPTLDKQLAIRGLLGEQPLLSA